MANTVLIDIANNGDQEWVLEIRGGTIAVPNNLPSWEAMRIPREEELHCSYLHP
jgi:hypothetical protein